MYNLDIIYTKSCGGEVRVVPKIVSNIVWSKKEK